MRDHRVRRPTGVLAALVVLALLTIADRSSVAATPIFPAELPGTADITFHSGTQTATGTGVADIRTRWQGTLVLVDATATTATYLFAPQYGRGAGQMATEGTWERYTQITPWTLEHAWGDYLVSAAGLAHPDSLDRLTVVLTGTGDQGTVHLTSQAGMVSVWHSVTTGLPQTDYGPTAVSWLTNQDDVGNGTYQYQDGQLTVDIAETVSHTYSWGADSYSVSVHLGGNVVGLTVDAYDANIEYTSAVFLPVQASGTLGQLADAHWPDSARAVSGVAADGVSLVLLRGKVLSSAAVRFTLEKGSAEGPLGSLWAVDDQSLADTTSGGGARDRLDAGGVPDDGPTDLSVTPVSLDGEQWVFALYRAPRNFDDGAGATAGLRERTIKIHASVPPSGTAAGSEQIVDMTVVRPLVLFMHGTWDTPDTWNNFPLYANSARAPDYATGSAPFYADRLDFASLKHAAGPVLQNASYLLPQVIEALRRWREKIGIAATQADVITHSYGGPSMRFVAQTQRDAAPLTRDSGSFRRSENWGHGDIHKLITLAATHRGSVLANHAAVVNRQSHGALNALFRSQKHDIDLGGAEDQFVFSDALQGLHQTRVPGHTFGGSGLLDEAGDTRQLEVVPFLMAWMFDRPGGPYRRAGAPLTQGAWDFQALRRLTNYSFNLDYDVGGDVWGDPDYDLTVSSASAHGGMRGEATSGIEQLSGVAPGTLSHLHDTTSAPLSQWIEFLLEQSIGSGYFAYFPAPADLPPVGPEKTLANRHRYDPAWLYLTPLPGSPGASLSAAAAAPAAEASVSTDAIGGVIAPGQTLQVSVSWPGKQIDVAMVVWPDASTHGGVELLSDGSSFSLMVPPADPGPFPISAVIRATDGTTDVASVRLQIADTDTYTGIVTDPPAIDMRTTYSTALRLYGRTAGGELRDVTASGGTSIVSADPTVVEVMDGGLLQPVGFGTTTLQVTVQNVGQVDVPASVSGTPVAVKAMIAGPHPTLNLKSGGQVGFAFVSGPGFDARTLVTNTIRVGGERPVRVRVMDVNRDHVPDLVVYVKPKTLTGFVPGTVEIPMIGTSNTGAMFGGVVTLSAK